MSENELEAGTRLLYSKIYQVPGGRRGNQNILVGGSVVAIAILVGAERRGGAKLQVELVLIGARIVGQVDQQGGSGLGHRYGKQLGLAGAIENPFVGSVQR